MPDPIQAEVTKTETTAAKTEQTEADRNAEIDDLVAKVWTGEASEDLKLIDAADDETEKAADTEPAPTEPDETISDEDTADDEPSVSRPELDEKAEAAATEKGLNRFVKQGRRYRDAGDRALQEAQRLQQETSQRLQALEQRSSYLNDFEAAVAKGDVERAIDMLARRSGHDPADVMQAYIEKKAGGGEGKAAADMRIARLEKELQAEREERVKFQGSLAQREREQRIATLVQTDCDKIVGVKGNESLQKIWPNLAKMPKEWIAEEAANRLRSNSRAYESLDNLAAELDKKAEPIVRSFQGESPSVQSEPASNGKNSQGQGIPAQSSAKPGSRRPNVPPTLSNRDAASGARSSREMTKEELDAEADRLEQEIVQQYFAED